MVDDTLSDLVTSELALTLAAIAGVPIDDQAAAARIAAGASAAIKAVRSVTSDTLFDCEPSDFLATLEQLADPVARQP